MNDFSFPNIFRAAFNIFAKNFTDIFIVTVLSLSSVLVASLFFNSVFLGRMSFMVDAALTGNALQSSAGSNPFIMFSVYIGIVLFFAVLVVFCIFSLLFPLCKSGSMKLRNYVPSFHTGLTFICSLILIFAVFGVIIVVLPFLAKFIADSGGYSAAGLIVSMVSFAAIVFIIIFSLRYIFYFIPLLEGADIKEALKKSRSVTNNCRLKIFALLAVLFLINFFAKYFIFFLLITVPFSVLVVIYAYLDLSGYEIGKNGIIKND